LRQSLAWDTAFFTSPGTLLIFRVKLILVLWLFQIFFIVPVTILYSL
jgi:hypothetical protein